MKPGDLVRVWEGSGKRALYSTTTMIHFVGNLWSDEVGLVVEVRGDMIRMLAPSGAIGWREESMFEVVRSHGSGGATMTGST